MQSVDFTEALPILISFVVGGLDFLWGALSLVRTMKSAFAAGRVANLTPTLSFSLWGRVGFFYVLRCLNYQLAF